MHATGTIYHWTCSRTHLENGRILNSCGSLTLIQKTSYKQPYSRVRRTVFTGYDKLAYKLFICTYHASCQMKFRNSVSCSKTDISAVVSGARPTFLHECSIMVSAGGSDTSSNSSPQMFQVRLEETREERWCIYEIWTRSAK